MFKRSGVGGLDVHQLRESLLLKQTNALMFLTCKAKQYDADFKLYHGRPPLSSAEAYMKFLVREKSVQNSEKDHQ
jgi:hypothetical protein